MSRHRFIDMDDIAIRRVAPHRRQRQQEIAHMMRRQSEIARMSELFLHADEQRGRYILGDDPSELSPAVVGGTVEIAHVWTRWDAAKWAAPWLGIGVALGIAADIAVRMSVG